MSGLKGPILGDWPLVFHVVRLVNPRGEVVSETATGDPVKAHHDGEAYREVAAQVPGGEVHTLQYTLTEASRWPPEEPR